MTFLQGTPTAGAGGGGGGGAGAAGPAGCNDPSSLILMAVMFAVMYFLLIRPQQKRQKEHDNMLKSLRKGSVVRTSGGIRGEVFSITDRDATLIVADKTKINVLRSHIAGIEPGPKDTAEKAEDKK